MQNPLRSEAAMFRFLLWSVAVAFVVVVIALIIRAIS
jgi:hypothetical protein